MSGRTHRMRRNVTFEIRRASPRDHGAILAINAEGVPGVSPLDREELGRLAVAADPLLVAVRHGRVAGYLIAFGPGASYEGTCYLWLRERHPRSLYIDQVAVGAESRRSGAASALYDAIADMAVSRSLEELTCEVNLEPPNPVSMRFHERRGFREVGRLDVPDGRRVSLQARSVSSSA
jgi:uncharacterized protein